MKFYVAAKYERREEARELMRRLRLLGHVVVGDWTHHTTEGLSKDDALNLLRAFAKEDRAAVESCDGFVVLHDDNLRGGLVELGIALGSDVESVHVIGGEGRAPSRGAIFYFLPEVQHHPDAESFLDAVGAADEEE